MHKNEGRRCEFLCVTSMVLCASVVKSLSESATTEAQRSHREPRRFPFGLFFRAPLCFINQLIISFVGNLVSKSRLVLMPLIHWIGFSAQVRKRMMPEARFAF